MKYKSAVRLIHLALIVGVTATAVRIEARSEPEEKTSASLAGRTISIDDVYRFYQIYDAANRQPSAEKLQHDYLDKGSEGLHEIAKLRHITGAAIATNLAKHPEMYSNARDCADVLPQVRQRLAVALRKLSQLYPEARVLPVTIVVGRGSRAASEVR